MSNIDDIARGTQNSGADHIARLYSCELRDRVVELLDERDKFWGGLRAALYVGLARNAVDRTLIDEVLRAVGDATR